MSPTPPRYLPRAAATPTLCISFRFLEMSSTNVQGRLRSLSVSSNKVGEGIEKIYGSAKVGEGIAKVYGKAWMMGIAAADFCNRKGWSRIPGFVEANVINFTDWSQLPGLFKGLSCVFNGASEVLQGSSEAFGAMGVSSRLFHAVYANIPSFSYTLPKAGRAYRAYAGGSCPQQGINNILSYHIIKRSSVDSVLVVQESNGSRRSPKKVLPRIQFIKTLSELKDTVKKFKKGDPVHLIDVLEEDIPLEIALEFWKHLLAQGATALLRRDSNLCRMSKIAHYLLEEKKSLQTELETLNIKVDEIKNSVTLLSDMLKDYKAKVGKDRTYKEY